MAGGNGESTPLSDEPLFGCMMGPRNPLGRVRAEEIVKFRRVVGSDWLEYIYNV